MTNKRSVTNHYEEPPEALTDEATIQDFIEERVHTSETHEDTDDSAHSEEQENMKHSVALGLIKGLLCYAKQEALNRDELKQLFQKLAKHAISERNHTANQSSGATSTFKPAYVEQS